MDGTQMPKVSIIMAAKDTAPYLRECLDSILAQTYSNWELIAMNDHSSDDTPIILNEYAQLDERIKTFDSVRNKLIPTLKEAVPHITGSLINRMDSDDRMPLDKLEVMVAEWQKHGQGSVVAGGTEHFVDEGEVGGGFLRYENWLNELARTNTHYQQIYQECVIPSHCWMMHRDDFDKIDGFEPEIYPEDYDLCFRMYGNRLKIVGLDKVLHFWRDRSDRISRTWDEYKDNRYFDMKVRNFFKLDRDKSRPLVLWGAGRNGKDLAKELLKHESEMHWVCDNERKIGKDVYGVIMSSFEAIPEFDNPQILIAVASPTERKLIQKQLEDWDKAPVADFWFFM
jgi:glycosyltransferase involved in cell wall biosynthesis